MPPVQPFLVRHASLLFTCKTFLAAALALILALWLDLSRPYWAMATVYITSQPLAGATSSKAFYRVLGTLIGAAVAVAAVPNLVNAPELLCLAVALWAGFCLYLSLLDRTPRAYAFMLAGYTVALIGFPAVSDPASIFDVAVARVEEITLGIVCATLVSTIILPQSVVPVVTARVNRWLTDAGTLSLDVLCGRSAGPDHVDRRLRLAADAVDIDGLAGHLAYDPLADTNVVRGLQVLRSHMLMLLPLLAAVGDRIASLGGRLRERPAELIRLLDDLAPRLAAGAGTWPPAKALRADIAAPCPRLDAHSSWEQITTAGLLVRLRDLVDLWNDCRALSQTVTAGGDVHGLALAFRSGTGAAPARHRDHGLALWSAVGVVLAILLCSAFWIATGWPDGADAPMMAAVACSFFATHDDPAPGIRSFTWWSLAAIVVVAVYLFAIVPAISNIEMLIAALAPPFLAFGLLIARPQTALSGMALGANSATLLALQSSYDADFEGYANSSISFLAGMAASVVVTRLVRSVEAAWVARRLMKTSWMTLALTAERHRRNDRTAFAGVMLDRLGLLVQRRAVVPDADRHDIESMTQLRVGLNIIDLHRARNGLTKATLSTMDTMLDQLAAACRKHRSGPLPFGLLLRIDDALAGVLDEPAGAAKDDALISLVGIRHGLFPEAPAWQPRPTAPRSLAA